MALQDYGRLPVFYNGAAITQLTSVEATFNSGQNKVDLLNEGLGGFTPGSGEVTIRIGIAMPIGGTEYAYIENTVDGAFVDLQLGLGAKAYAGRGKIMNSSLHQSVNASVEGTIEWLGEFKKPS